MNDDTQADNSDVMMLEILEKRVIDVIAELEDVRYILNHLKKQKNEKGVS